MSISVPCQVPLLGGARFSRDGTRFCSPSQTGFACYQGTRIDNGDWRGILVGIADTEDDQQHFLDGEAVELRKR